MRYRALAGACIGFLVLAFRPAAADVLITISKPSQRMAVMVDGEPLYLFVVSTGKGLRPTPSGFYRPIRLERQWYSRKYDDAPMPHAIFFHHGYAIHGTVEVRRLGRPASHGCVRLHPADAARLFALVRHEGMSATRIVVSDRLLGRIYAAGDDDDRRVRQRARAAWRGETGRVR
jgi:lipoprotein-anchoring transpeptidase ErfK/SrfK